MEEIKNRYCHEWEIEGLYKYFTGLAEKVYWVELGKSFMMIWSWGEAIMMRIY